MMRKRTMLRAALIAGAALCALLLPAVSASAATITAVKLKALASTTKSPTITMTGKEFGPPPKAYAAAATPCGWYGSLNGDWWGEQAENHLWFVDHNAFEEWTAGIGKGETGDCIGIVATKWTETTVVFKLGVSYGSFAHWTVFKGDEYHLAVAGALFTGHAT
jgi:hypothetical protein